MIKGGGSHDPRSRRSEWTAGLHRQRQLQHQRQHSIPPVTALADALLGNLHTYTEASADPLGFFRFWQPGAFIQDSWRATRRLSLEFGLRWEWLQPWTTDANNMANFVPALYNPANAVTVTTTGTVVPGSGNLYNGLIRAGDGIPSDEVGRVPGATGALFQADSRRSAARVSSPPQNVFSPRFGFAYSLHAEDGHPRRLWHVLCAPARQHDLLAG